MSVPDPFVFAAEHGATSGSSPDNQPGSSQPYSSLLFNGTPSTDAARVPDDLSATSDLNLDQVMRSIIGDREEADLLTELFHWQLPDAGAVRYRHEVFQDLERQGQEAGTLFEEVQRFAALMLQVRTHLAQIESMTYHFQRQGWFLDAASIYCGAVQSLADALVSAPLRSRALLAFRAYLDGYVASPQFTCLAGDTLSQQDALAEIRYCTRIRGGTVEVSRYEDEPDYSAEVLETFDRFKQGATKDYRVNYRTWPGMNHVAAQILDLVARLFCDTFSALDAYCLRYAGFLDHTVRQFEREAQFYLAYLEHIGPLRKAGLIFCFPEVTARSKDVFAADTFDLALASKLVSQGTPIVTNDFHLDGPERVFVVSGPNQGGKTTFARTFGQLHHLAGIGCPVPGSRARLFRFDRLFTHFEREEDLTTMRGKLEDDLVRIRDVLGTATSDSIVIMNEIFTSTTLQDACYLGQKVLAKVVQLDLLCVYVTFVDELASFGESVVSLVSTIMPDDPSRRTFKVIRAPADGLAYALAIAEKYGLTYEQLRSRVAS